MAKQLRRARRQLGFETSASLGTLLYTRRRSLKRPGCVAYVIGTMPKEVLVNPIEAEVIGADYLISYLLKYPDLALCGQKGWKSMQRPVCWF